MTQPHRTLTLWVCAAYALAAYMAPHPTDVWSRIEGGLAILIVLGVVLSLAPTPTFIPDPGDLDE